MAEDEGCASQTPMFPNASGNCEELGMGVCSPVVSRGWEWGDLAQPGVSARSIGGASMETEFQHSLAWDPHSDQYLAFLVSQ